MTEISSRHNKIGNFNFLSEMPYAEKATYEMG